ncbi:MAG: hypothetical protein GX620_10570 [Chloroflexi bacterium]|nr:hypothetical protein [Chloroflexota bacterium]
MDFRSRILAVLRHEEPDQVPFAPYDNLMPRGDFSRQLRNRGMGLCVRRSTIWSEMPNVTLELRCEGGETVTTYHTPVGSVSTRTRGHTGRISDGMSVEVKGMIERVEDFGPVIFMLDDTVFHRDDSVYWDAVRDVGVDGIVRDTALDMESTPYGATRRYFGDYFGLERWVFEQHDHPNEFVALLEAQIRRDERRLELAGDSPADLLAFGWLEGLWSPALFREYELPFYRKWVSHLQARGRQCVLHCDATKNLPEFAGLIAETGVAVVEAFTPPPVGTLSLSDARVAWGDDVVIWVNVPETVFWMGADQTKAYIIDLLKSDSPGRSLVIGFTEMGLWGATDDETERTFKAGIHAMMEAIEECGHFPVASH